MWRRLRRNLLGSSRLHQTGPFQPQKLRLVQRLPDALRASRQNLLQHSTCGWGWAWGGGGGAGFPLLLLLFRIALRSLLSTWQEIDFLPEAKSSDE